MRRKLEMIEIAEILFRWDRGLTKRNIARSLGMSRNIVKEIVKLAEGLGLTPGITSHEKIDEIAKILVAKRYKKISNSNEVQIKLSNWHNQLDEWYTRPNMTVTQIMRLLAENGEIVSETSLRRYMKKHFIKPSNITIHLETAPAKQAQVDYGYVGMFLDPIMNKLRRAYAFIMTLSHSRHRFVYFVFRQDAPTWIDCHVRAFDFFGGVVETILLDNLKAGVIKPNIYDPTINRSYAELERHYSFVADPAKVRKPEHKGKVERSVTIIKQQLIAGRDHKDICALNIYAEKWCRHEIAHRIVRTTGETPWERYIRDEKHLLLPLPKTDFECAIWQPGFVHRDHHIVFLRSFYSVPTKYIGKTLWLRATLRIVQIYHENELIKTHIRASHNGQWQTDPKDYPEYVNEFLEKTPKACLGMAQSMGKSVHAVIAEVLKKSSITNQRKAQAILRLAKKYSDSRLEAACTRALEFDNLKYVSIKRILDLNLEKALTENRILSSEGAYLRHASEFATI
jgi:hypothetical protein